MYDEDLEGTISLLRAVRWLFLRLPIFVLVVRGVSFITDDGRISKGIIELAIAAAILVFDLWVVGGAIRKRKKLLKDPVYQKKLIEQRLLRAMKREEKAAGRDDGILYRDFELSFAPAKEQYCKQTGKNEADLTDADREVIWEYAYAPICYLFAWIAERGFYQPSEKDGLNLAELVPEIKARMKLPSFYIAENEGTLYKDNIKTEALEFVQEYMNNSEYVNGHEVAKKGDIIGAYYPEVEAFAREHLHAVMYGFPFRWEDYDVFKANIDAAWMKYSSRNTKQE